MKSRKMALKCCVCNRHVPLYMMITSENSVYIDPVVVDTSFICKRCWDKKRYEVFIE